MTGVLMARRGPKRRLDVEAEYWRLLQSGVGTVEACKQLGIGRKTGYRWRAENGGLPRDLLHEAVCAGADRPRSRFRGAGVGDVVQHHANRPGAAPAGFFRRFPKMSA
ncbi:hypothetical protein AB0442_37950 [Kitasatospora sp. NPDC085895]|uniref:hypothetical protein n=1 Tax=Kitasatospora sp. NPDC085895 TaxID=3155057 RepID=UPI00344CD557